MQTEKPTNDVAILALMIAGVLTERLGELGQIDEATSRRLHHLIASVRAHAHLQGGDEFDALFDRIEAKLHA